MADDELQSKFDDLQSQFDQRLQRQWRRFLGGAVATGLAVAAILVTVAIAVAGKDGREGRAGRDAEPAEVADRLAGKSDFQLSLAKVLVQQHEDDIKGPKGDKGDTGDGGAGGR